VNETKPEVTIINPEEVIVEGELVFNYEPNIKIRDVSDEAISELEQEAKDLPDITTSTNLKWIKGRRTFVKGIRTAADKYRKELKAPALQWCDKVEREFRDEIEPRLKAIEKTYNDAIDAETKRKKDEKEAAAKAEAERVVKINDSLQKIRDFPLLCMGKSAKEIEADLTTIESFTCSKMVFEEKFETAIMLHNIAKDQVRNLFNTQKQLEDHAAESKAKDEAIEKERKEAAINQALSDLALFIIAATPLDSKGVLEIIDKVEKIEPRKFGDRKREAQERIDSVLNGLHGLFDSKVIKEAVDAQLLEKESAAREALAKQQARDEFEVVRPEGDHHADLKESFEKPDTSPGGQNPVQAASDKAMSEQDNPEEAYQDRFEMMSGECYEVLTDLLDENSAEIIMEALVAGSIPHVQAEWIEVQSE